MDEESIWPIGVKRTKQREGVLAVLQNANKPLSAVEICAAMAKSGNDATTAWLSTVYRVLELFVEKGFVIKTNLMNSGMALYELNRLQHKHYAVCVHCHKIIALENCPMEHSIPELEGGAFKVIGHNLEVFGVCGACDR